MGFGGLASQLIMFIAVVLLASTVVMLLRSYSYQTTDSLKVQKDILVDTLKTSVKITSVSFLNSTNTTIIYAKNTGKTRLHLNKTEVYVDGYRYGYDNRTSTVEEDTKTGDTSTWNPQEVAKFTLAGAIATGVHNARIVATNGVYDDAIFSS